MKHCYKLNHPVVYKTALTLKWLLHSDASVIFLNTQFCVKATLLSCLILCVGFDDNGHIICLHD